MKLEESARLLNETLECRYPDINGQWMFSFENGEIKEDACLVSVCGRGKTMDLARSDYIRQIIGKTIVFHAMDEARRREVFIPESTD